MLNYNPTFFDISIVRKRADKIAYVLSKVAGAGKSLSEAKAEEFDDLLSNIPYAPEPEEAVYEMCDSEIFDLPLEKAAHVTGANRINKLASAAEKLAMIKQIQSNAVRVLNSNLANADPLLKQTEPDFPTYFLDSLARKFAFEDILRTCLANAISLRPHEATRIIIVQTGMPLERSGDILNMLLRSSPMPYIGSIGEPRDAISRLLQPFLMSRSSFLPAIMHRVRIIMTPGINLEKQASTLDVNIPMSYYDLNPKLNFGTVRRVPAYLNPNGDMPQGGVLVQKDNYSQIPAIVSPHAIEMERRRPKINDDVPAAAAAMGSSYAAYKDTDILRAILENPLTAAATAAAALYLHSKLKSPPVEEVQKQAAAEGIEAGSILPFSGVHFAMSHFTDWDPVVKFASEYRDIIDIAAPLTINTALRKHASVADTLPKSLYDMDDFLSKVAGFGEDLKNASGDIMTGLLFRTKRRSPLSAILDQTIDRKLMGNITSG